MLPNLLLLLANPSFSIKLLGQVPLSISVFAGFTSAVNELYQRFITHGHYAVPGWLLLRFRSYSRIWWVDGYQFSCHCADALDYHVSWKYILPHIWESWNSCRLAARAILESLVSFIYFDLSRRSTGILFIISRRLLSFSVVWKLVIHFTTNMRTFQEGILVRLLFFFPRLMNISFPDDIVCIRMPAYTGWHDIAPSLCTVS